MIWILRNEEGRGFIQINGWVCEMNRIQHKKWIDTLGIGLFILTLLYMCGLTSNKDEIEPIFQKIYFLIVELVVGGRIYD